MSARRPHVLIVGAGFGGLATARGLADAPIDVTIVDRHNFHTFQPLLYQVATAGLNPADVAYPVRGIFQQQDNVAFRHADVAGVDWRQRRVVFADGADLGFDHLVIAAGASTNFFGVIGAEEHAFPLYSLAEAAELRNHVLSCFEAADRNPALIEDGALNFVVVGGGPTGVEVAGALSELISHVLSKDFQHLAVARARVLLVEREDHLLPPFHPKSQFYARQTLVSRGVEVRLRESVERITATRVHLGTGEVLPSHTLIWAAGIQANPLATALGVEQNRGGRIVVGPDLVVKGREKVFAIGDVAHVESGRVRTQALPQLAPVAMQTGNHVARQIRRLEQGKATRRFRYLDKGTMATVGRRAAVAELPLRIRLHGSPAWLAWLGLHLLTLVGFRNRVSVFLNWAWSYLTWDRGPRLIFSPLPEEDASLAPSSAEEELGWSAATAGYSGTALAKKLGIKEGSSVALLGAPDDFESTLAPVPAGVTFRRRAQGTNDVIVAFYEWRSDFEGRLASVLRAMDVDGGLWVAWPKKASKVPTDITEDTVREVCLPLGLVDNKVCAIDDVWSGLRVVWRKELRAAKRG